MAQTEPRNPKNMGGFVRGKVCLLAVLIISTTAIALAVARAPIWVGTQLLRAQLCLVGIHSYSMILDGQRVHYIEGGTGDPIVLVHGLGATAQFNWRNVMPPLMRSGHHVYAMDLLGYGESAMPADRTLFDRRKKPNSSRPFSDAKRLDRVAVAGRVDGWMDRRDGSSGSARNELPASF
jgi:hypothetical protein